MSDLCVITLNNGYALFVCGERPCFFLLLVNVVVAGDFCLSFSPFPSGTAFTTILWRSGFVSHGKSGMNAKCLQWIYLFGCLYVTV